MIYNMEGSSYSKEDLEKLGIYDLRELGREVGVPSPTTMKKDQLIEYIVGIIHGAMPKNNASSLRGRPARTGQKSYQKFVDLIDKVEAPTLSQNFLSSGATCFDDGLAYQDTILSGVASFKAEYKNDAKKDELLIQKGVVCVENDQFYARKLKFVKSPLDIVIPLNLVNEYALKDNDIIEYFVEDGETKVSQIIKINGNLANKLDVINMKNGLSAPQENINIFDKFSVKSKSSNIVIASSQEKREELTETVAKEFNNAGYSVCKVCFDKLKGSQKPASNLQLTEYFPETIGDEFETVALIESAVERSKFYTGLGFKTVIVLDNLNWLINVLETYPQSIYGNFIQKLAKLSVSNQTTVVCFTSPIGLKKMNDLIGCFDVVLNIDQLV
ncbi:MAG: hypothetical protein IJS74_01010 [Clostridia bacterium]|nr:hypothetical protein [Clostridia bacterium]